jgi:YHS domain-containing protein
MFSNQFSISMKQVRIYISLILVCCQAFACNQQPKSEGSDAGGKSTDSMTINTDAVKIKYTAAMVDNQKDPNCGMPVTAGIEDTVHYNGKAFGFCSEECKAAFLKNPEELAKNAELK